jgi:hypothetical protein
MDVLGQGRVVQLRLFCESARGHDRFLECGYFNIRMFAFYSLIWLSAQNAHFLAISREPLSFGKPSAAPGMQGKAEKSPCTGI